MPNTIAPELYQEILDAKAVVEPQIRGLEDLKATSVSPALAGEYNTALLERDHRLDLLNDLIAALDAAEAALEALIADGYPALPTFTMPPELLPEHNAELSDLQAGASVFGTPSSATRIDVTLGQPIPKDPMPARRK